MILKSAPPHLLVAISSHGFGHVAQVAPVVNALWEKIPDLRLTLRTTAPSHLLATRMRGPFEVQAAADDFGMVQRSALAVDEEASAARYAALHAHWEAQVEEVAGEITAVRPDVILADVPYLTLAAAAEAGIPSVAMCSLHWADIYRHYCGSRRESARILEQMWQAYRSARWFLRPAPSMPMNDLPNVRSIDPVAEAGVNRREELNEILGLAPGDKLVLVSLGGISTRLPAEKWPRLGGLRWIFQRDWRVRRDDALVLENLGMSFSDLLASSDLLLTKPGYGSFVEAVTSGVPVLYVERGDWPETACLTEWLHSHGHGASISQTQAETGKFDGILASLLAEGRSSPRPATGAHEAAELLLSTVCR